MGGSAQAAGINNPAMMGANAQATGINNPAMMGASAQSLGSNNPAMMGASAQSLGSNNPAMMGANAQATGVNNSSVMGNNAQAMGINNTAPMGANTQAATGMGGAPMQQSLTIVPVLNSNQPLYQYNPQRKLYVFVPDEVQAEPETQVIMQQEIPVSVKKDKKAKKTKQAKRGKKGGVRVLGIFAIIFAALLGVFAALDNFIPENPLGITSIFADGTFLKTDNLSLLLAVVPVVMSFINPEMAPIAEGDFGYAFVNAVDTHYAGTDVNIFCNILPILFALGCVMVVASLIQGIVYLCSGKAAKAGWIVGLLQTLFFGAAFGMICVILEGFSIIYGAFLFIGISLLSMIFSIIACSISKKSK